MLLLFFFYFLRCFLLQVPFIAMYRKEECLSLLRDPDQHELFNENQDNKDKPPTLKWHKVNRVLWKKTAHFRLSKEK